jgi:hypothetical protein
MTRQYGNICVHLSSIVSLLKLKMQIAHNFESGRCSLVILLDTYSQSKKQGHSLSPAAPAVFLSFYRMPNASIFLSNGTCILTELASACFSLFLHSWWPYVSLSALADGSSAGDCHAMGSLLDLIARRKTIKRLDPLPEVTDLVAEVVHRADQVRIVNERDVSPVELFILPGHLVECCQLAISHRHRYATRSVCDLRQYVELAEPKVTAKLAVPSPLFGFDALPDQIGLLNMITMQAYEEYDDRADTRDDLHGSLEAAEVVLVHLASYLP